MNAPPFMPQRQGQQPQLQPSATIAALFESQVARSPAATALIAGDESLNYMQLDRQANRLARHLAAQNIGPESVVALALPRSIDMVAAIFGVLKAGAAYLPLDPAQPAQRTGFMLADSGAAMLLARAETLEQLGGIAENLPPTLCLDDPQVRDRLASLPGHSPATDGTARQASPDTLAYIIYTSGSTGTPKGVAVTHRSVVNLAWRPAYVDITPADTVLQYAPFAFDAAVFEVFGALLNGARLMLGPPGRADIERLGADMLRHKVTVAWFTAGLFELVANRALPMLAGLRQLIAGGDVLPVAAISRVQSAYPELQLINGYGPTETTTFACTHRIGPTAPDAAAIPIGRPIRNVRVFILDAGLSPVAPDAAGELYIAGEGLARGYFGRPGLTAERFLPCPFGPPGARMYRTGDLARWRADGAIDFLGRADDQLKLRGVRIEPAEIVAALTAIDGIAQAALVPHRVAGDLRLIAYLVPAAGSSLPADATLRQILGRRLPDYMIPAAFIPLDSLPLTPNGKLDRARLPPPAAASAPAAALPSGATARRFAAIWQELLGTGAIDPAADLFALGGDSLLAFAFLAQVEQEFGRGLPAGALVHGPTIQGLAEIFDRAGQAEAPAGPDSADTHAATPSLRDALRLRVVRAAHPSRGVVLGMPGFIGHAAEIGIIAGHALHEYDVWTFSVETGGRKLTEDWAWLEIARAIADRLLAGEVPQLRALAGFSLGGYMAWLVDRLLVVAGRPPTPIINFDGDVLHAQYTQWASPIQALLAQRDPSKTPVMLLLRRAWPQNFALIEHMEAEWREAGVALRSLRYPTLDHLDIFRPAAVSASRDLLAGFIENPGEAAMPAPKTFAIDTVGGTVFRLLNDPGPLPEAAIRAHLHADNLPQDATVQLALLVLALRLNDPALAVTFARRITAAEPSNVPAAYAEIRLLTDLGRAGEAAARAESWRASHPDERDILRRAQEPRPPTPPPGAPLAGFIDHIGADLIEGWAQDRQIPERPVTLDILVDGRVVSRIFANGHRTDLLAAGQGSGCHAFSARLPFRLTAAQRANALVRCASSGAVLPRTREADAAVEKDVLF